MVVSTNPNPKKEDFQKLLNSTLLELNAQSLRQPAHIEKLTGDKLEPFVRDIMIDLAVGSEFENSIELIGGQKFPDIVANKFYGIEVKTTTKNHWKTTGNSVLESTRIDGVERIFMLFGKLFKPIEFKIRPYEECLSEIVVTHSPRYLIDMNLEKGKTIFDKVDIPYDVLRRKNNPIKPIINYYREKLKPGQDLWWIEDLEQDRSSNLIIDIWSNLTKVEKKDIKNKGMAYFPEVFSNHGNKFGRVAIWLVTKEAIVCPNIRDLFTAGGRADFKIDGVTYKNIPQIFIRLFQNFKDVLTIINSASPADLSEFWEIKTSEHQKIDQWRKLIIKHSQSIKEINHLAIQEILNKLIQQMKN